jgi:conjugal transfer pilus assembly protein TraF
MRFVSLVLLLACPFAVMAQDVRTDDAYGDAFVHYQPYVIKGKEAKRSEPQRPAASRSAKEEQKVTVQWLQRNYKLLEERAINDPSDENVAAYLYVRRITMDKSQRFAEKVTEVTNADPLLNENNRIPYASAGAQSIRSADRIAQGQAASELAQVGGLVVFVDGSCRFCPLQMPVLQALRVQYGMETLVVSLDGKRPRGYEGPLVRDNGLFRKLELKLTPSVVYVHRPRAYKDGRDDNKYWVVSQGFYAQDEMVKQIAFAGHSTRLLSQATMRDLAVWDRGVASTEDLGALALDSNDPAAIRRKLRPILQKQYQ